MPSPQRNRSQVVGLAAGAAAAIVTYLVVGRYGEGPALWGLAGFISLVLLVVLAVNVRRLRASPRRTP